MTMTRPSLIGIAGLLAAVQVAGTGRPLRVAIDEDGTFSDTEPEGEATGSNMTMMIPPRRTNAAQLSAQTFIDKQPQQRAASGGGTHDQGSEQAKPKRYAKTKDGGKKNVFNEDEYKISWLEQERLQASKSSTNYRYGVTSYWAWIDVGEHKQGHRLELRNLPTGSEASDAHAATGPNYVIHNWVDRSRRIATKAKLSLEVEDVKYFMMPLRPLPDQIASASSVSLEQCAFCKYLTTLHECAGDHPKKWATQEAECVDANGSGFSFFGFRRAWFDYIDDRVNEFPRGFTDDEKAGLKVALHFEVDHHADKWLQFQGSRDDYALPKDCFKKDVAYLSQKERDRVIHNVGAEHDADHNIPPEDVSGPWLQGAAAADWNSISSIAQITVPEVTTFLQNPDRKASGNPARIAIGWLMWWPKVRLSFTARICSAAANLSKLTFPRAAVAPAPPQFQAVVDEINQLINDVNGSTQHSPSE